jgi:hypothetical protein
MVDPRNTRKDTKKNFRPETMKKRCPQITQITLIFLFFFIICVNLCNLWAFFIAGKIL